ncbi:MAG: hypothetical protein AB1631_31695, partial [Acidobacteriota bacterium]
MLPKQSDIPEWRAVGSFKTFGDLSRAVSDRKVTVGVDPLVAAQWGEAHLSRLKKFFVAALSLLLFTAAAASIVGALWFKNYWMFAAIPVQAAVFYLSQPALSFQRWATAGGAALIFLFAEFLLSGWITAATLTAYAGLTFAAVRASNFITGSAFRKALMKDERLFLEAFDARA